MDGELYREAVRHFVNSVLDAEDRRMVGRVLHFRPLRRVQTELNPATLQHRRRVCTNLFHLKAQLHGVEGMDS